MDLADLRAISQPFVDRVLSTAEFRGKISHQDFFMRWGAMC